MIVAEQYEMVVAVEHRDGVVSDLTADTSQVRLLSYAPTVAVGGPGSRASWVNMIKRGHRERVSGKTARYWNQAHAAVVVAPPVVPADDVRMLCAHEAKLFLLVTHHSKAARHFIDTVAKLRRKIQECDGLSGLLVMLGKKQNANRFGKVARSNF